MAKAFFIDLTRCTGCRGCQVACKQWKNLPAEQTSNTGSHTNPPDLSAVTLKTVHMHEVGKGRDLKLLAFPEQCRHCLMATCMTASSKKGAIVRDKETGAVLFTPLTAEIDGALVRKACPYDIPRMDPLTHELHKCDMCNDRVHAGKLPACVQTCPTGAMNFGEEEAMDTLACQRLAEVRKRYPDAVLGDAGFVRVIYLYAQKPTEYHPHATFAENGKTTRRQMFAKLFQAGKGLAALLLGLGLVLGNPAKALSEPVESGLQVEKRDLVRIGEVFRTPIPLARGENPRLHVVFQHSSHKGLPCATCHHEVTSDRQRYTACANQECHSIPDRTDKSSQSRFVAYHAMDTDRSCYGCHFQRAQRNGFLGCTPCHEGTPER